MAHLSPEERRAIALAAASLEKMFLEELEDSESLEGMWAGWRSYLREMGLIAVMIGESHEDMTELREAGWRIYRLLNHPHTTSGLL